MRSDDFTALSPVQQASVLVSMYVLNAIADSGEIQPDEAELAALAPVVRTAVFEALTLLRDDSSNAHVLKRRLLNAVPNDWEMPAPEASEQVWTRFPEVHSDSTSRQSPTTHR